MKANLRINCPKCEHGFELGEVFTSQVKQEIEAQVASDYEEKLHKAKIAAEKEALKGLDAKLAKEKELWKEEAELENQKALRDQQETQKKLEKLEEANKKLKKEELEAFKELQRQKEELEKLKSDNEIAVAKEVAKAKAEMAKEQGKLQEGILKDIELNHQLQRKQDQIEMEKMRKQIDILQKKASQSISQQLQGESLELLGEEFLRSEFPADKIDEIKKGQRGSDVLQTVRSQSGKEAAKIKHEFKWTQNWSSSWVPKIKEDMALHGADVGIIISAVLPKDIQGCGLVDDIWVMDVHHFKFMVAVIRKMLLKLYREELVVRASDELKEGVFKFVTSSEFAERLKGAVAPLVKMSDDLEKERRAMAKIHKVREVEINRALDSLGMLYASVQGITNSALPLIDSFELPSE